MPGCRVPGARRVPGAGCRVPGARVPGARVPGAGCWVPGALVPGGTKWQTKLEGLMN